MLKKNTQLKEVSLLFMPIANLSSCKKEEVIDDAQLGVVENQTFNSTLFIDGHNQDGTIIRNCIFENINADGLQIRDVKVVHIIFTDNLLNNSH